MKAAPVYLVTYHARRARTLGLLPPVEFSVPCWEETTEAIYKAWQSLYGRKWEARGLVSIFADREKRQVWPKPTV